jgi:predicted amidohydrolase
VAAVQMKFADSIEGNLNKMQAAVHEASRRQSDVVLFPECAVKGCGADFPNLKSSEINLFFCFLNYF